MWIWIACVWAGEITTVGHGQVSVAPDAARIQIQLTAEDEQASKALAQLFRTSEALIADLMAMGIDEADLRTQNLSLVPSAEWRDGRIVREYFVASHSLSLMLRRLDDLGTVADRLVAGNQRQSFFLQLVISDPEQWQRLALTRAMQNARINAEIMVGAEERVLGDPVQIDARVSQVTPNDEGYRLDDVAAPPISPGEQIVSAQVTVTYAF